MQIESYFRCPVSVEIDLICTAVCSHLCHFEWGLQFTFLWMLSTVTFLLRWKVEFGTAYTMMWLEPVLWLRPMSWDSWALEFILLRSCFWSWHLGAKVSVLVS